MKQAADNDWFEYPAGSQLHYFCFPERYRLQARDGVTVFFKDKGPTQMRQQPRQSGPEERDVLKSKISKFIKKGYIVPLEPGQIKSLIKYFAVPKGILDSVVQDWRVVFHAGANKLNNSVWAPFFALQSVNSLLRIVDSNLLMSDRDMGEMFLNFGLDWKVWKFAAIDLGPLKFSTKECGHRWMTWSWCLMGFRLLLYNVVKLYLIAEEILRGDRHDPSNAFQYKHVWLKLPGTLAYLPSLSWISKRRHNRSLASNFVCFVDNQRVMGEGGEQVVKAEHALSSRESYLGLQDALRMIRYHEGTRQPGALAGACVVVEAEIGVAVLVSQEKWDTMKEICNHWLLILRAGGSALDYKRLQSDRGFMVYVTQAYPSFKPYLKGFHLSLETWQEGQDSDGWKVDGTLEKNKDQTMQGKPQASEDKEESQAALENQKVEGSMDKFKLRT